MHSILNVRVPDVWCGSEGSSHSSGAASAAGPACYTGIDFCCF
jgi:hypothetical protein